MCNWSLLMIQLTGFIREAEGLQLYGTWSAELRNEACWFVAVTSLGKFPGWTHTTALFGSHVLNLSIPTLPVICKNGWLWPSCSNFFGLALNLQVLPVLKRCLPRAPVWGLHSSFSQRYLEASWWFQDSLRPFGYSKNKKYLTNIRGFLTKPNQIGSSP